MNIENAGYALSTMDFSQLGVAGVVCALLFGGLVYAVNHFKAIIKELNEKIEARDAEIKLLNTKIFQIQVEHSEEIRDVHINTVATLSKVSDTLSLIRNDASRRQQGH